MEYVILDKNITINGEDVGSYINIIDITGNIANVNISNREAEIYSVIINSDPETSIKVYFDSISDKDIE